MIRLHQYPPAYGLPSLSPFCIKIETYLRLTGTPYETVVEIDPRRGPRGRLPFIEDGGRAIADSHLILDYLEERVPCPLDARLSAEERAQCLFVRRLADQDLIRVILYSRWVDPRGWSVLRKDFLRYFPRGLRRLALGAIRRSLVAEARGSGILEYREDEIYRLGAQLLGALAAQLGQKRYLFGDRPTTADATVAAFVAVIAATPIDVPLRHALSSHPRLTDFAARILRTG